ncbi:hypothetical protein ACJMK2_031414 [Sinanodonta woodiana]|uniref:Uncharacterized protein n=1 Tax=Sinanodonta woodiana TaxID=1069815 RepID=A0ABD3X0I6_SINWO
MATGEDVPDAAANNKRSLVVDEAAFEEQFLRCNICRDKFDQAEKCPKSLPCNHTFCLPCLKQVFDHNQDNSRRAQFAWTDDTFDGMLKCPTCRVEIFLSRSEISALPNDHRVIQMMDFLSQVVVKTQNVCTKHERQPLNFFCRTCIGPVCRDCTVLDHKEAQGHKIVDVSEALNENKEEFNNMENKGKQLLGNMKSRSDSLANSSKRLDLVERQLRSQIKDTFIEYRLLLERRQEGQIKILHEMIKERKSAINSRFVEVCTKGSELQKLFDTFTKAKEANDVQKLFKVHQKMKEKQDAYADIANANDDNLFVSCKFEVENEGQFLSEMSCLGEVTSKPDLDLKKPVPAHQLVVLDMEERRYQESTQLPDPQDCEDLIVTRVEPSTLRERPSRSRPSRYRDDDPDAMDHEEITSSYLMRIASRLNATNANLSEAILGMSPDSSSEQQSDQMPHPQSSNGSRRGQRSRRSQNQDSVRVIRHPLELHNYTSSRYSGSDTRRNEDG